MAITVPAPAGKPMVDCRRMPPYDGHAHPRRQGGLMPNTPSSLPDRQWPPIPGRLRPLRIVEGVVVFGLLPPLLYFGRYQLAFHVVPLLWIAAGLCRLVLHFGDPDARSWPSERQPVHRSLLPILAFFVVPAALLTAAAWRWLPEQFVLFPRSRTGVWLMVMVLYPVFAAWPQELIFRRFFFARYGDLFPSTTTALVGNALSFGLAHLMYANWIAPLLSSLGGLLFAWRYLKTGSVAAATIEHGLWGNFLFTVGIGWFFYSGSIP
jgi:membrane protease YdiL (CAAX protease family)